jgi:hypothetical protein
LEKTEPAVLCQAAAEASKEHSMTSGTSAFLRRSLNDELDWFRARCKQEWPPEAFDLVNQTLAELAHTGIHSRALKADDTAPVFTLPDQAGVLVHSQDLLSKGPLVVNFYRGMW